MDRRTFTKALGVSLAAARPGFSAGSASSGGPTGVMYYADGYHGGVVGHMPPGCWRDILNALRGEPRWKISLDIEPASWEVLKRRDPEAYHELATYLEDANETARIEMVGCTFSQPYGWANSGESNIRQVLRGIEIIRHHFGSAALKTYAVQEPCWASCLPQILRSAGFDGASLKNASTAWGGYTAGYDAELVQWCGPDGTSIPTVPRYACERLQRVYETESIDATPAFARKCEEHGIRHPVGMCFQDLGWPGRPKVSPESVRFVTWREYIQRIADPPKAAWRFSIEDILTSLPWGEHTLQTATRQVRSAENRLLVAEKLAALSAVYGRERWPLLELQAAWDDLMLSQAHDGWITVTTRTGRDAWAFRVAEETLHAEETANEIVERSVAALNAQDEAPLQTPIGQQWLRVANSLPFERTDLVEFEVAADRGTTGFKVIDGNGHEMPCQINPTRWYLAGPSDGARIADGAASAGSGSQHRGINTARILFRPDVPALGHATYRLESVYGEAAGRNGGGASTYHEDGGATVLENNIYRLRLDPDRGGAITGLFAKQLGKEFCDSNGERLLNEYRGYFIAEQRWCSSTEKRASISILESGPERTRVQINGTVGGVPYQTMIGLVQDQRRIDFSVRFHYTQDTWIGAPWDIPPEHRREEGRRSQNDGRWKLQALFPVAFRGQALFKNAAYDVCRSRNENTYFERWDEIKHNIIVHWVDLVDESQDCGLALFSDHTTAYTHGPDHPLALVLGWGAEGGFWWGKCPLRGTQEVHYALIPHRGNWEAAHLHAECSRWHEPLVAQVAAGKAGRGGERASLLSVDQECVEVPTVLVEGKNLLVRLFNASAQVVEPVVSVGVDLAHAELIELSGQQQSSLALKPSSGRTEMRLSMPPFAIRTLRCGLRGGANI